MLQSYYAQAKVLHIKNRPKKNFRQAVRVIINLLVLIGLTAAALLACLWTSGNALVAEEIFPSGTTVNGCNIGGMSFKEGSELVFSEIGSEFDNYAIPLEYNGFSISLNAAELGIIDGIENMLYNSTYLGRRGEVPGGVHAITNPIRGKSLDLTPILDKSLVQDTLQSALSGNTPEEYAADESLDSQSITGTTYVNDGAGAEKIFVTVNAENLNKVVSEIVEAQQAIFDENIESEYDTEEMTQYRDLIEKYAGEFGLDPAYIATVVYVESSFDPKIESPAGAVGLMQILPSTGIWIAGNLGISNFNAEMLFDPETNIRIGCWYVAYLLDLFDGNLQTATVAYNAGPTRALNWLGDERYSSDGENLAYIPFTETKAYADQIDSFYEIYKSVYRVA